MKIIDAIIVILCAAGLVYFFIDRLKYRNINVYHEKLERLNEIRKLIAAFENDNLKDKNIINSNNLGTVYDDGHAGDYVIYEYKLGNLLKEKNEIEKYIRNFRMYNKNLRIYP